MHREVARRLLEEPEVLATARARVEDWCRTGSVALHYAEAWSEILARPPEEISRLLTDTGERARALRQVTPFAGVVPPRVRWRIWREVAGEAAAD